MIYSASKKMAVITGANSGIGMEASKKLSRLGYHVVMTVRTEASVETTLSTVSDDFPEFSGQVEVMDLSSLASVQECAQSINDQFGKIDVLVNNAGILPKKGSLTAEGYEIQFCVNYLAPALFTLLLLEKLKCSEAGRIVNVSSMTHKGAVMEKSSWRSIEGYRTMKAYRQSKLALTMFTNELSQRLSNSAVCAFSMHPGAVASNIYRDQPKFIQWVVGLLFISSERGAHNLIEVATSERLEGQTGLYFHGIKEKSPDRRAEDRGLLSWLWRETEDLLSPYMV